MKFCTNRGISLIEILVAMGVLVVLAALLIPRMLDFTSAENIRCISRLRSTGTAFQSYLGEHNNYMIMRIGGGLVKNHYPWPNLLWREGYLSVKTVAAREVLRCPSWHTDSKIDSGAWPWHTYGLNTYEYGSQRNVDEGTVWEMNFSVVKETSRHVLVADSVTRFGTSQTFRLGQTASVRDGIHLRHRQKANVYFLDGHVSAVSRQEGESLGIPFIYDRIED